MCKKCTFVLRKHLVIGERYMSKKANKKKTKRAKRKTPYTQEEWAKIEELASGNGKTFKSAKLAKKYLDSLIPNRELWIHKNPKILKSIREGIQDIKEGHSTRVKDLDKFLKEL